MCLKYFKKCGGAPGEVGARADDVASRQDIAQETDVQAQNVYSKCFHFLFKTCSKYV